MREEGREQGRVEDSGTKRKEDGGGGRREEEETGKMRKREDSR